MKIDIREESPGDAAVIRTLIEAAFADVPESDHREQHLVERLHRSPTYVPQLSLVAETAGRKIVGYILLTQVSIESENGSTRSLSVAPLAVLPAFQKRGIGGMLLKTAHTKAASLGYGTAVLLGHQSYYPRFGYRRAADLEIVFPFDAPSECCMIVELLPRALDSLHGTVRYPDPFFET